MNNSEYINSETHTIPLVEWIIAALGAALVFGTFGFLVYRGLEERKPPSFSADIQYREQAAGSYAVTVLVHNHGGQPVSKLVVQGSRLEEEKRELTIDYLPAHSARRVTFLFHEPIENEQFRCSFLSYNEP